MVKSEDGLDERKPKVKRADGSRAIQVHDELRDLIRSGGLKPGTRIREEDIARSMGVSRTPVREAISRLQSRGLLTLINGGLSIVVLTRPQIMELYAIRGVLEGSAARFAAENASASDLATMEHIWGMFERYQADAAGSAKVNIAFHEAIYEAAHNRYQVRMLEELNDYLALLPSTTFAVAGRAKSAREEHLRILEAIKDRDPDKAESAARYHIRQALSARLTLMFDFDQPA